MNFLNKNNSVSERRNSPRIKAILPVELLNNVLGETIDISETGISLKFREDLTSDPTSILLNSTTPLLLNVKIQTVWKQVAGDGIYFGARFLDFTKENKRVLKEGLSRYKFIDPNFINLVLEIRHFLQKIKAEFDEIDKTKSDESQQISFIEQNKNQIFTKLNKYFDKIWEITKDLDRKSYDIYQHYFYQMLEPLLGREMEINTHIHQKPLGYPGDYAVQNYIIDYHTDKYLGNSSYQKLINHYTCNTPISKSNVRRKEFFKDKILDTLKQKDCARILSVCSGPMRELIELTEEGKIDKPLIFKCIDFEERTLRYIMDKIGKIEDEKRRFLKIEYIHRSIPHLIKNRGLKEEIGKQDLVYSSGLFDYLTDNLASRFTQGLYALLASGGVLIICNASLNDSNVRSYYELLGDWIFYHRTKEQLLEWVKGIKTAHEIKFQGPPDGRCYLYMHLRRG